MHFTAKAKSTLEYLLRLDVPESAFIDVDTDGRVAAQCATQAAVRELRAAFGAAVVWIKAHANDMQWWTYDTTLPNGILIHIYPSTAAAPTCRAVVEEI